MMSAIENVKDPYLLDTDPNSITCTHEYSRYPAHSPKTYVWRNVFLLDNTFGTICTFTRPRTVGPKNMTSSSGWLITNSTRFTQTLSVNKCRD